MKRGALTVIVFVMINLGADIRAYVRGHDWPMLLVGWACCALLTVSALHLYAHILNDGGRTA